MEEGGETAFPVVDNETFDKQVCSNGSVQNANFLHRSIIIRHEDRQVVERRGKMGKEGDEERGE